MTFLRRKNNPLRRLFGGSDRPHHLAMSTAAAMPVAALAYHYGWLCLVSSVACLSHEWWATSDRDMEENRKWWWGHWYWLPYGLVVPHRSWASHGLFIGTAIRLAYGWWWLLWPLWLVYPPVALAWCGGALVADVAHWLLDL